MNMKKTTIIVEDRDSLRYRQRLDEVLSRYKDEDIYNIDTGVVHDNYDSHGCPRMYYYAIIIVNGNGWWEE